MTIKRKLWGGSILFVVMTTLLCGFAYHSLRVVTSMAQAIFERPLMVSGQAGGIATAFLQMDRELVRAMHGSGTDSLSTIADLQAQIEDSLAVIDERATGDQARQVVADVRTHLTEWKRLVDQVKAGAAGPALTEARERVVGELGDSIVLLVEYSLASGFEFKRDADRTGTEAKAVLGVVAISAMFFGAVSSLLMVHSIVTPLYRITGVVRRLSEGHLDVQVTDEGRHDELGDIARAVGIFQVGMVEKQRLDAEHERAKQVAEAEKVAALHRMAETVEVETRSAVDGVASHSSRMAENAALMAQSAAAVSENSQSVAVAAEQAQDNAQTVSAATAQLTASIDEIAQQIGAASQVTAQAVGASDDARATIGRLSQTVARIDEVARLINDIASQTNLLALNATIEAARAGEAGKGFAVVAGEVKHLANQTAKATEEISGQIGEIQRTTAEAVAAVGNIIHAIEQVESVSTAVGAAIRQQGVACDEIARSVAQTSAAAHEVATRIASVSAEAAASGNRAAEVHDTSVALAGGVTALRDTLIRVVRTSTHDVDRRNSPRQPVCLQGRLSTGGHEMKVVVENLSEGGALLIVNAPIEVGASVEIAFAGVRDPFPATVVGCEGERLRLRLELSEVQAAVWSQTLQSLSVTPQLRRAA